MFRMSLVSAVRDNRWSASLGWDCGTTREVYQVPEVDGIPGGTAVSQVTGLPEQICGSSEFSQAVTARFLYA